MNTNAEVTFVSVRKLERGPRGFGENQEGTGCDVRGFGTSDLVTSCWEVFQFLQLACILSVSTKAIVVIYWREATTTFIFPSRGGSRIGTVELQHPLLPLDIIDNMSPFFFNSFFIHVQCIILKINVSSHPPVYEKDTIFWSSTPTNFSYEPPLLPSLRSVGPVEIHRRSQNLGTGPLFH
jgi:hypothetical protein